MFVFFLDAYHLGDPLFLTGLARDLKARHDAGGEGVVIVHGVGEAAERAIEATGREPVRVAGALQTPTAQDAALVERAGRDLNRQIVHELNDAGVHAIRVTGADRGLVRPDGTVGKTEWLATLARQRGVAVVVSLAPEADGTLREADPAVLSARIARSLASGAVVALGTPEAGVRSLSGAALEAAVPDADALRRMGSEGVDVVVARRSALRSPGSPEGARVEV